MTMSYPSSTGGSTTSTVGYFCVDAVSLANWLVNALGPRWSISTTTWHEEADMVPYLRNATPDTYAFVPAGEWALLFTGGEVGTDVGVLPSRAASTLGVMAVRAVCADGEHIYPATILDVYGPDGNPPLMTRRSIAVVNDGGRWIFETFGDAYEFEDTSMYVVRRKAGRFTCQMLRTYLRHLGIPVDVEPTWSEALVVSKGLN